MATKTTKKTKPIAKVKETAALIAGAALTAAKLPPPVKVIAVPVGDLHPGVAQYRTTFDPKKIDELADSLRRLGQLQDLTVRKRAKGGYELVGGERRWRAAKVAKLSKLTCKVY